jgi:hypothetical protein
MHGSLVIDSTNFMDELFHQDKQYIQSLLYLIIDEVSNLANDY